MSDTAINQSVAPQAGAIGLGETTPVETPVESTPVETSPSDDSFGGESDSVESRIREKWEAAGLLEEDGQVSDEPAPTTKEASPEEEVPVETKPEAKPESEDDLLAKELGIDPKKNNKIPYAKVKRIIDNKLRAAEEAHSQALSERETKLQAHQDRLSQVEQVEKIMAEDPEQFLQMLTHVHPRYAQILLGEQAQLPNGSERSNGPLPMREHGAMPQPDYDMGNGQFTYSPEGLQRLMEWQAAQTEARVMQTFAPVLQQHQAEQRIAAVIPQVTSQLADAETTWPMFNESKAEILKVLQSDPKISLEGAWRKVVTPKMQTDRNKVREEVLAELKTRPRSTSTSPTAPVRRSGADGSGEDLDSRIKAAWKEKGLI